MITLKQIHDQIIPQTRKLQFITVMLGGFGLILGVILNVSDHGLIGLMFVSAFCDVTAMIGFYENLKAKKSSK